jgi:uncharacterized membrane protein (UPF0127 family)
MTEPKARGRDFAVGMSRVMRPFLVSVLVLAGVVALLLYGSNRPANPTFDTARRIQVGERCLRVLVADTDETRAQGVRGRDNLGDYHAMLFVYEQDVASQFTMSGVTFPLTIGFYDAAGNQVDQQEMEPCPDGKNCRVYGSKSPFRNAIEAERGELPAGSYTGNCPT